MKKEQKSTVNKNRLAAAAKHLAKAHELLHKSSKKHLDEAQDKKLIKKELDKRLKKKNK